jgi:hypothetical protein
MPTRFRPSSGPSSGSQDKNRSAAASTARRLSTLASALASSTDTPTHKRTLDALRAKTAHAERLAAVGITDRSAPLG